MKLFEIEEFGIDNLKLVDREVARPKGDEVLVRMRAASLNFRDYMTVNGSYNPKMRRPTIPLSDGAGIVEEIGPEVARFKIGDRVAACFFQNWIDGPPTKEKTGSALGGALDGVLREYVIFREDGLVPVPAFLTDEQAAALPCAGVTAWHALFEEASPVPGASVLIQGTGGVSVFALQFAAAAGFRTIVASSSDEKLARARQLGATDITNYRTAPDWDDEARRLTGGEGVDQVIEVGGGDTLPRSLRAVRMGGVVSVIGVLGGGHPTVSPVPILINSIRVQGIYVGSRAMFERMNRFVELHRIQPVVGKRFPWLEIKEALRHMESQQHFGKICLSF